MDWHPQLKRVHADFVEIGVDSLSPTFNKHPETGFRYAGGGRVVFHTERVRVAVSERMGNTTWPRRQHDKVHEVSDFVPLISRRIAS